MRTIEWDHDRDCVRMVDQTRLPATRTDYHAESVADLVDSIQRLRVRGAPALGAAGAYGVALAAREADGSDDYRETVHALADRVATARPTAVNLSREVEAVLDVFDAADSPDDAREATLAAAERIADEDVDRNRAIGDHGASLLADGDTVLTHCNAGALATVDWGTALGVVYSAHETGKHVSVLADETRPLNQGSRITTVELAEREVPVTLQPDNAAGLAMQRGRVDAVVVGADRVVLDGGARFGDQAVVYNKIGTYQLAVLADRHDVPFVVAAPTSTVDADGTADDVEIEERDPGELREIYGQPNAPADVPVSNPAFDATPAALVDHLVTERGVFDPPLRREELLGIVVD